MAIPVGSATLVGAVAAVCTTGAFVPQVVRVWRLKSASEISLTTFTAFAVGTFVWFVYGLLIDSVPVVAANAVTFGLAVSIVALKLSYDRASRRAPAGPDRPSG